MIMHTLNTILILTLQQLDGIGNKTILKIAEQIESPIATLSELCDFWASLKGKKFESITSDDLEDAYRAANRIIGRAAKEDVGVISFSMLNILKYYGLV